MSITKGSGAVKSYHYNNNCIVLHYNETLLGRSNNNHSITNQNIHQDSDDH